MNLLKSLPLILSIIFLSGCSFLQKPEEVVVTQVEYVEQTIPRQPRPEPLDLYPIQFYAVTEETLDDFITRFEEENGVVVFFAISVPSYENMALNMADMKRYIEQQKAVILYYESFAD